MAGFATQLINYSSHLLKYREKRIQASSGSKASPLSYAPCLWALHRLLLRSQELLECAPTLSRYANPNSKLLTIPNQQQYPLPGTFEDPEAGLRLQGWEKESGMKLSGHIFVIPPNASETMMRKTKLIAILKETYPNLLVTNFFIFHYYRENRLLSTGRPLAIGSITELSDPRKLGPSQVFQRQLDSFFSYSPRVITEYTELQKALALKTFYLGLFVLPNELRRGYQSKKPEKHSIVRLYQQYCEFFNRELEHREFCFFLSHVATNGHLRAFYRYWQSNFSSFIPFSRAQLNLLSSIPSIPKRRQEVYQYFASPSLAPAVEYLADDITATLATYPLESGQSEAQFCQQWEGYFFQPYYQSDHRKRILNLLKQEGILKETSQ